MIAAVDSRMEVLIVVLSPCSLTRKGVVAPDHRGVVLVNGRTCRTPTFICVVTGDESSVEAIDGGLQAGCFVERVHFLAAGAGGLDRSAARAGTRGDAL